MSLVWDSGFVACPHPHHLTRLGSFITRHLLPTVLHTEINVTHNARLGLKLQVSNQSASTTTRICECLQHTNAFYF